MISRVVLDVFVTVFLLNNATAYLVLGEYTYGLERFFVVGFPSRVLAANRGGFVAKHIAVPLFLSGLH